MRRSCYPLVAAALLLAGCGPRYVWKHPGLDPASASSQGQIDSAECNVIAMQAVPQPNHVPTEMGGPGNVDMFALSQNQINAMRYNAAIRNLANACMLRRGWVKVAAGQPGSAVSVAMAAQPERQPFGATVSDDMSVNAIKPGDVAARAGIMPGDTIVTFGGRNLNSPRDLQDAVSDTTAGQTKEIDIFRGDQHLTVMASF